MVHVTLRKKPLRNGRQSLYLDFYPPVFNQEKQRYTRREFLGLYLVDQPADIFEKEHNKETKLVANRIRSQRENALNKPELYSESEKLLKLQQERQQQLFIPYVKQIIRTKKTLSTINVWNATVTQLELYKPDIAFADITASFLTDFKEHLKHAGLKHNSIALYYSILCIAIKQAVKDDFLPKDPTVNIPKVKPQEVLKTRLTLNEFRALADTPCKHEVIKTALIFAGLTGERVSDLMKLTWRQVVKTDSGWSIEHRIKKTGAISYKPISQQAKDLLGAEQDLNKKLFDIKSKPSTINKILDQLAIDAGLHGVKLRFHTMRHTYATLLLNNAVPIEVVSKLLGHSSIAITQVYAKINDESKRQASNTIQL